MITRETLLMGRDAIAPLTAEMEGNLISLIEALQKIETEFGREFIISSGYRPKKINQAVGGAKFSRHQTCQAADVIDSDGTLAAFVQQKNSALERAGLWVEHPAYTPGWVHFQICPPKSGRRIFIP